MTKICQQVLLNSTNKHAKEINKMKPFKIMCDNMGDLPASFYQEHDVRFLSLTYTMEDVTYDETHTLSPGDFYAKMRLGAMPTTSQINPEHAKQVFQEVFAQGYDILCLTISGV